jgi:hypothetical protein
MAAEFNLKFIFLIFSSPPGSVQFCKPCEYVSLKCYSSVEKINYQPFDNYYKARSLYKIYLYIW